MWLNVWGQCDDRFNHGGMWHYHAFTWLHGRQCDGDCDKASEHGAAMVAGLTTELQANVRVRCERALQIATTVQLVPELIDAIEPLLEDEDQYTRLAAVRTLATCDLPESIAALRRVLLDHAPLVAQAAEEALSRLADTAPPAEPPVVDRPEDRAVDMNEIDEAVAEVRFS